MNNFLNRREMMWKWAKGTFRSNVMAAIRTVFTTEQVGIIQAWARTADQYLIDAVNEYAINDPRMLCSLVSDLNIYRTLDNSTSAFILSPMVVTSGNLKSLRVEIDAQWHDSSSLPSWAAYGYDNPDLEFGYDGSGRFVVGTPTGSYPTSGNYDGAYAVKMMHYVADYKNEVAELYEMDGTRIYSLANTGSVSISFYGYGYALFQGVTSSGTAGNSNCHSKLKHAKFYLNDVIQYHLIPYTQNGVNGLLDLVNGTFHASANSSTFTISEETV